MKTDLLQFCGHCWVFQIGWHTEWSTLTASCFRIWKSSRGIPKQPLALFVVMLPKASLTSHSRMSGFRWVITPSWLVSVSVQSLSRVRLFVTPLTAACQASLSITNSQSLPKLMSIESVMPYSHLILCHPLLLLTSIFSSMRVFPMSQLFASGGQSIGVAASTSVLPMNTQDWSL